MVECYLFLVLFGYHMGDESRPDRLRHSTNFSNRTPGIGTESELEPDQLLDSKYRLIRPLGMGGMGEIWEAEREGVARKYALKLLRSDKSDGEENRARFLREIEATGRVYHDNICEILDFGFDHHGIPFYVMPLISGKPLSRVISSDAPLPLTRALDIAFQLLEALAAAHVAGVIHRDLKPDNVVLTCVGDRRDFVKVLDFGISKIVGRGSREETRLTRTGAVLGTPHYMAPEQARGDADIDERVDLFAVGAILYELVVGRKAIPGETSNEILWHLWNAPLTPPRAVRADLPIAVEQVILTALCRDREARYHSTEAMRSALSSATGRDPTPAALEVELDRVPNDGAIETDTTLVPMITTRGVPGKRPTGSLWPRRKVVFFSLAGAFVAGLLILVSIRTLSPRGGGLALDRPALVEENRVVAGGSAGSERRGDPLAEPADGTRTAGLSTAAPTADNGGGRALAVPEPAPRMETPPAPSADSDLVRVTLRGVPPTANVTVDGRPVVGSSFEVERSREAVRVVVRVSGHRPWVRRVETLTSTTLVVRPVPRERAVQDSGTPLEEVRAAPLPPETPTVEGTVTAFGQVP